MISGIYNSMETLYRLSDAKTRSLSAENPTGEKGKGGMATEGTGAEPGRELGQGWKISPSVVIAPGTAYTMADVKGSGAIQHIWLTLGGCESFRDLILRMYWDGEKIPAVEVPVGDFFANGWNSYAQVSSLAVCVNPAGGFNCYFAMPFRTGARITLENRGVKPATLYYQIDYVEAPVEEDAAYFCAAFNRSNPTVGSVHTILDNVSGKGQYVGTYLAWQVNNNRWWGEGEIKFFMDGDKEFPTICGTGTEDYFCGAYNFDVKPNGYTSFCTPYSGLPQIIRPDGLYTATTRFGLYRWHIADPIRFEKDLRVTIQDLGWRSEHRYLPQMSDISSVAYWYQQKPFTHHPVGTPNELEII